MTSWWVRLLRFAFKARRKPPSPGCTIDFAESGSMEKPDMVSSLKMGVGDTLRVDPSASISGLPTLPLELNGEEAAAIRRRRTSAGLSEDCGPHVGLALSGGGIRSATYSLGVLRGDGLLHAALSGRPLPPENLLPRIAEPRTA